jgi:hypothetical protein
MKSDFKIFIGWDMAQSEAAEVCADSIRRFTGNEVPIAFIQRDVLSYKNLYWRPHDPNQSTDFAFTRFLTPYLAGFYGSALFCDCDFFWRKDPREILKYQKKQIPVQVVQHDLTPQMLTDTKMNGRHQSYYPKKNWSSLMLFNMDSEYSNVYLKKLTPRTVSENSAGWLHQFEWYPFTDKDQALPPTFNHLAGYGYNNPDPHAVHFTDGGPWLSSEYNNVEFAQEWIDFRNQLGKNKCTTPFSTGFAYKN